MAFNMRDLNKLVKFARKNGITHLKVDGIEMHISPGHLIDGVSEQAPETEVSPTSPQYTDEQILNWSSTSYVESN